MEDSSTSKNMQNWQKFEIFEISFSGPENDTPTSVAGLFWMRQVLATTV
jgi:hypothetical protein